MFFVNLQKIADFGLATKLEDRSERHYTMCGTPNFISPEIASRQAHGLEADVWSAGVMLYTMLAGQPPFDDVEDGSVKGTLDRVIHAEFNIPKEWSVEAKDLVSKLLQKQPEKRLPLDGECGKSLIL